MTGSKIHTTFLFNYIENCIIVIYWWEWRSQRKEMEVSNMVHIENGRFKQVFFLWNGKILPNTLESPTKKNKFSTRN